MTKFEDGSILTSHVIDCQVYAIGKDVRPLFTDLVIDNDSQGTMYLYLQKKP